MKVGLIVMKAIQRAGVKKGKNFTACDRENVEKDSVLLVLYASIIFSRRWYIKDIVQPR